jgi:tetratricopeptide (TPR) repeat protein
MESQDQQSSQQPTNQKNLKHEPNSLAEEQKTLGNQEYTKKNFDQALLHYDKAIEIDPAEPLYYNNKAAVYLQLGQPEKTLELCEKALEVFVSEGANRDFVKEAKILARKASAYTQLKNYDKAIDLYGQSLNLHKDPKISEEIIRINKLRNELNPDSEEMMKKKELIDLIDDFSKNSITGMLRGLWKVHYAQTKERLETVPDFEITVSQRIISFIPQYFNQGIEQMVTNGPDKYFYEQFSKMKSTLNHGYRCLFHIVMNNTMTAFKSLDLKRLVFFPQILDFANADQLLDEHFDSVKASKFELLSHTCGYKDEDITQWDPKEPFYILKYKDE